MPDSIEKLHPCSGNRGQMSTDYFSEVVNKTPPGPLVPWMNYLQTRVFLFSKFPFHNVFFEVSFYLCFHLGPESQVILNTGITSPQFPSKHNQPSSSAMFIPGLSTTSKTWTQLICSSADKENVLYTHSGILFSLKKEGTTIRDEH